MEEGIGDGKGMQSIVGEKFCSWMYQVRGLGRQHDYFGHGVRLANDWLADSPSR